MKPNEVLNELAPQVQGLIARFRSFPINALAGQDSVSLALGTLYEACTRVDGYIQGISQTASGTGSAGGNNR